MAEAVATGEATAEGGMTTITRAVVASVEAATGAGAEDTVAEAEDMEDALEATLVEEGSTIGGKVRLSLFVPYRSI